jgi:hypothetical protein
MTDEELVKALRDFAQNAYDDLAADRIEELTAERDAWKVQYAAEALGLHVQMQRAEAAEAKLAKAMRIAKRVTSFEDTTEDLAECGCDRCKAHLDLRATLAEIEGEKK